MSICGSILSPQTKRNSFRSQRPLQGKLTATKSPRSFRTLLSATPRCASKLTARLPKSPRAINWIVEIVNGDVITYSQVRELSATREKLLRSQYTGQELEKALKEAREAALKDLIDRRLIIQAFQKEKFQIPDHFVDEQVHGII